MRSAATRRLHVLWFSLVFACATFDTRSAATHALQEALQCEQAEVEQVGEFQYRAHGCGQTATTICTSQALEPECHILGVRAATQTQTQAQTQASAQAQANVQTPSSGAEHATPAHVPSGTETPSATASPEDSRCSNVWSALENNSLTLRACIGDARAVVLEVQGVNAECRGLAANAPECSCLRQIVRRSGAVECDLLFPIP